SMTGVLKIPRPVWNVQRLPPDVDGVIGLRPSCALVRRNLGQGLSGSSGTSYWKGARVARSFRRLGRVPAIRTTPFSWSQWRIGSSARSFTAPSNPVQLDHTARMTVPLRVTLGL